MTIRTFMIHFFDTISTFIRIMLERFYKDKIQHQERRQL